MVNCETPGWAPDKVKALKKALKWITDLRKQLEDIEKSGWWNKATAYLDVPDIRPVNAIEWWLQWLKEMLEKMKVECPKCKWKANIELPKEGVLKDIKCPQCSKKGKPVYLYVYADGRVERNEV